jgi:uncharacterized protein (DUF58 family)
VLDERGEVSTLWAGMVYQVQTVIWLEGTGKLPFLSCEERLPFGAELVEGNTSVAGELLGENALTLAFNVQAPRAGQMRFEGVRVQMADIHGLYYHTVFLREPACYRVLPPLVDAEGKTATTKRNNLMPPPGINRVPRPGSGSELLDLRDYLPGDPPKTIAWKISARRDKLITKEYESEVPVRCTLFVDVSSSVRVGPPAKTALGRLVEISSAVAQANMGIRDLTGLCLFDEKGVRSVLRPARSRRHLIQILNQLGNAAGLAPESLHAGVARLTPLAYTFASEVYPEQMQPSVNRVPAWLPFFNPVPGPWVMPRTGATLAYRLLALPLAIAWFFFLALAGYALLDYFYTLDFLRGRPGIEKELLDQIRDEILPPFDFAVFALVILCALVFPLWLGFVRDTLPLIFNSKRRRHFRQRKKLAAFFARRYDLGPGGLELLLQDDRLFGQYLQRFLAEHNVPHVPALYDRRGRFLFRSEGKLEVLSGALLRSIGKGHDNELYVLMVDLVEVEDRLPVLLKAVKVALGRHHQVMLVCPWPAGVEPPGPTPPEVADPLADKPVKQKKKKGRGGPRFSSAKSPEGQRLSRYLHRLTTRKYHRAFHRIRRAFARLHVPVVCAEAEDPVHLILERLDRLRGMRRRR